VAIAVLLLWLVWAFLAAAVNGEMLRASSPYVLGPLVLAAGVACGQVAYGRVAVTHLSRGTVALMATLLVLTFFSQGATGLPLGYANANAALALQLMALSGLVLLRQRPGHPWSIVLAVGAAAVVVLLNRSAAAGALAVPLALTIWWSTRRGQSEGPPPAGPTGVQPTIGHRLAPVLAGLLSAAAAAAVMWLAVLERWPSTVESALSSARHTLWRDALTGLAGHPATGLGPGSFTRVSRTGQDTDLGAAHSAVLQVGAETGWPGVVLLALLTSTALWWVARGSAQACTVGAAAVAALMVHAQVDHLLEYAPLVLVAGVVIGLAGASGASEQLDVAEGEGPVARRGRGPGQRARGEDRSLPG